MAAIAVLSACGGGSSREPTAPAPPPSPQPVALSAGVYTIALDGGPSTGGTTGTLIVTAAGEAVFTLGVFVSRGTFGSGTLLSLRGPRSALDDNGSESIAATGAIETRQFQFIPESDGTWRSGSTRASRRARTPATSLPLRWFFNRPYFLQGIRETYDLRLEVGPMGSIVGSDSTGCVLSGRLSALSSLYDVQLNVTSCGPSDFYIRNGTYSGLAFVDLAPQVSPPRHTLALGALRTSPDAGAGISLFLTEQ